MSLHSLTSSYTDKTFVELIIKRCRHGGAIQLAKKLESVPLKDPIWKKIMYARHLFYTVNQNEEQLEDTDYYHSPVLTCDMEIVGNVIKHTTAGMTSSDVIDPYVLLNAISKKYLSLSNYIKYLKDRKR